MEKFLVQRVINDKVMEQTIKSYNHKVTGSSLVEKA